MQDARKERCFFEVRCNSLVATLLSHKCLRPLRDTFANALRYSPCEELSKVYLCAYARSALVVEHYTEPTAVVMFATQKYREKAITAAEKSPKSVAAQLVVVNAPIFS